MKTKQKMAALADMPEIKKAVAILILAFKDSDLKSHLRFVYETKNKERYEITLMPLIDVTD